MQHRGQAATRHVPVLRDRIVELLAPALNRPGAIVLDGTLGMGGHAHALASAVPGLTIVGVDRDAEALELAGERLRAAGAALVPVHAAYDDIDAIDEGIERAGGRGSVDGALFDLGVSSLQLDEADRGFAYAKDAPLDMRMDRRDPLTAADVLATYSVGDLTRILRQYGEERYAARVAAAIVRARSSKPLHTSAQLVEIVRAAVPAASQRTGGHPAKRTFQALRIEVNDELGCWRRALPAALDRLPVGGRIAVLSYHSLEDRITKSTLAAAATDAVPPGVPVVPEELSARFRLLTRGAEMADEAEQLNNPRSTSVRLRAAERVRAARKENR